MLTQTVTKIGNSLGIIIPASLRKDLGLDQGTKVNLQITEDKTLLVSKGEVSFSQITPRFLEILEGVNKRYGKILEKLAKE